MKKIKILTIILLLVVLVMIAFFGIYTQKQNRMENQIKDYSYAMDINGSRIIRLKVNSENKTIIKDAEGKIVEDADSLTDEEIISNGYTKEETPYNSDEVKNIENYKISQKVIEKRLKKLKVSNYIIKLDETTGDIVIELTEDDNTNSIISNITTTGKFEIVDSESYEVLMDNNDIKLAKVMYGSGSTTSQGTTVYLDIEFTKEGAKKLEEISNKYVETEIASSDENTAQIATTVEDTNSEEVSIEDTTSEETTTIEKKITMLIDDEEIMSTSFDEPIKIGKLQLSIGSSTTDTETLQDYISESSNIATVLDVGNIPVKYDLSENQYVLSNITDSQIQIAKYIVLGIVAIALILLIIRYKTLGILGTISYVGLIAILMITIRYTNVILSIEGFLGIITVLILNYVLINKLLLNKKIKEVYKEFFVKIVPIIIIAITFCFINWVPISSFGMVMFWGILLIAIYNILITNNLIKIKTGKEK